MTRPVRQSVSTRTYGLSRWALPIGVALILLTENALAAAHDLSAIANSMDYVAEPMPPGFQVTMNEVEGPVSLTATA